MVSTYLQVEGTGEMFETLETSDFRQALRGNEEEILKAAIGYLQANDRNGAVGKIAEALQVYAMKQPMPGEEMLAKLYVLALVRVDYYTLALEIVQRLQAADPSLVKNAAPEGEFAEEEELLEA